MRTKVLVCAALYFLASQSIAAAQAPALHEGTFLVGAPSHCGGHTWCGRVLAPDAMRREGLEVTPRGDHAFGQGSDVTVMVFCKADGENSFAIVVATSMHNSIAERFRNSIRSHMTAARCL